MTDSQPTPPSDDQALQMQDDSSVGKPLWHKPKVTRLAIDQTRGGIIPERGEDETYFGIPIGTRF